MSTPVMDLSTNHYATISGVQGQQFGRDIYTAVLKFKDLEKFLKVFPEVQRTASGRKINKIKSYILTSFGKDELRFFSSLTVTTRGSVFYDTNTNKIAIDTSASKLSINDGQHRYYGVIEAIRDLERKTEYARGLEKRAVYLEQLEALREMVVPLVIFNQIDEKAEKQLFYDLNNLSSKPSKNVNIRLSQNDSFSVLSRIVVEQSEHLNKYGVEFHKQSIHKNNTNTILLTTVYAMCKNLFVDQYKRDNNFINDNNIDEIADVAVKIFDEIFLALPQDLNVKGKYIVEKSYCLRGISIFVQENVSRIDIDKELIFKALSNVDWTHNEEYWSAFGVVEKKNEILQFPGNGEGGINTIRKACHTELNKLL